ANLVNLFNPEVVVFGGVLRQLFPVTEDLVRAQLASALAAPREQVRLVLPRLGGDSILLGAAESAFEPLLDDPLGALARGSAGLRHQGGLSGYPSRAESPHDVIENSHASTALSWADGLAKARALTGELERRAVVAVVGDGALTGGMAWEALNNIAASDRPLVIVVNDNARSYAPTIGGLAHHLATLRTTRGYERFLEWGKGVLE